MGRSHRRSGGPGKGRYERWTLLFDGGCGAGADGRSFSRDGRCWGGAGISSVAGEFLAGCGADFDFNAFANVGRTGLDHLFASEEAFDHDRIGILLRNGHRDGSSLAIFDYQHAPAFLQRDRW